MMRPLLIVAVTLASAVNLAVWGQSPLEELEGGKVDIGLSAYHYYADRDNVPETRWLLDGQEGVLSGLLWEEARLVGGMELEWPEGADGPPPDALLVEKFESRHGWWPGNRPEPHIPRGSWQEFDYQLKVTGAGRRYVYTFPTPAEVYKLRVRYRMGADVSRVPVPVMRAYAAAALHWRRVSMRVEWGFGGVTDHFDGSVSAYNCLAAVRGALPGDSGTQVTGATAWRSRAGGGEPRGILLEALVPALHETEEARVYVASASTPRRNENVLGDPMQLGTAYYQEGFAGIPPLHLRLVSPEPIVRVEGLVGIDRNMHTERGEGSAVFVLRADDEEVFNSGVMRQLEEPKAVDVALDGVKEVGFVIEKTGEKPGHDHADWVNPAAVTRSGRRLELAGLQWLREPPAMRAANRGVVTLDVGERAFSFAPEDVEAHGQLFAPDYGCYVTLEGTDETAAGYTSGLKERGLKTIRERVAEMPEQNMKDPLLVFYTQDQLIPHPEPPYDPPMTIEVPEKMLQAQWRLGAWHLKSRMRPMGDGTWKILCYPYPVLAQESYLIMRALDYMGVHDVSRGGLEYWFAHQSGARPFGRYYDSAGCLTLDNFMDELHGTGPGGVLWSAAQHYRLTGGREWLMKAKPHLLGCVEWMARQRRLWAEHAHAQDEPWLDGLMPPTHIGDITDWRMWYIVQAFFYAGMQECGEVLHDIDPAAGRAVLDEADAFRADILRALDKSVELAPVKPIQDGTFRPVLPTVPYMRGLASQISDPGGMGHGGPLWGDLEFGALHLAMCGVIPVSDYRVDAFLDVMEDDLLYDNRRLRRIKDEYVPERDWFDTGGLHYQNGYMVNAMVYLRRDEVANFLRTLFNHAASTLHPENGYTFAEHNDRGHGVHDKSFEEAAFLERVRCMLVWEEDLETLWLARATPRRWLRQGEHIAVTNAPSYLGELSYRIESDVDNGRILAEVAMPERSGSGIVMLRLRHPEAARIQSVTVNGLLWDDFDTGLECISLKGLSGTAKVEAKY